MRVLIFHGYLLHGTGSNVYSANLAAALRRLGHEVHLLCQEPDPESLPFVDAVGAWDGGELALRTLREPVRCTVYRPDIGGLLPVYVKDRYQGLCALTFAELGPRELEAYLAANVAAVRDVAARALPQAALVNHLLPGPAVLARALAGSGVPYAVKVHGSALEYALKPHRWLLPYAREGLARASAVLVGSRHTAESLWAALDDPELPVRTRLGPPGVDIAAFAPRTPREAAAGLARLRGRVAARAAALGPVSRLGADAEPPGARDPAAGSSFAEDPAAAVGALDAVDPRGDRLVCFVGKLLAAKGVDLLAAAWPLVLDAVPGARLLFVGFGGWRGELEGLLAELARGELDAARARAARGGLSHLGAFLGSGEASSERYRRAAARLGERVALAGRLDHDDLADLLPACEAIVVPSTFPEAFGMVAVEGAACGALPISAAHSGLAEVSVDLARALPPPARAWLSFPLGPLAVPELAERLVAWLRAPRGLREDTRAALAERARERYSWEGVAHGVLAAAAGHLAELPAPA